MFDLITGHTTHIPSKSTIPVVVSVTAQAALVAAVLVPVLFVTGQLPKTPTMMAFVAAPPPPAPPPPPPPPPAAKPATPSDARPTPAPGAAPVDAPARIEPERVVDVGDIGVPGGVEGGIPGGVPGGILGGLPEQPIPPPPPPAPPARVPDSPIRVGGQIKEPTLVRRVEPVYPALAVQTNIRGTVILEAIVDAGGRVSEVRVLRAAHRLLDQAALEAVREWQYEPLVLNGIPERFVLTVVLSFSLT